MECKICEMCGYKNNVSFLTCEKCEADISYIPPQIINNNEGDNDKKDEETEMEEEKKVKSGRIPTTCFSPKLIALSDGYDIEIPFSGGVIGREGEIGKNYLEPYTFVGNYHMRIEVSRTGDIMAYDNNSRNHSWYNGELMIPNKGYILRKGDIIKLANISFRFEI